jgi:hypothetical protein
MNQNRLQFRNDERGTLSNCECAFSSVKGALNSKKKMVCDKKGENIAKNQGLLILFYRKHLTL